MSWLTADAMWIMAIGALVCASCGLVGCFLVLRKQALMGDAISHSVLPGIAIAVLISGSLHSFPVLIGAGVVGLLTPMLVDFLRRTGLVNEDAAIGTVFTVLFAIGVILVSSSQTLKSADVDTDCVLYGEIAYTPFDRLLVGGEVIQEDAVEGSHDQHLERRVGATDLGPRPFWILLALFGLNIGFILFFYKELKICAFDPALAEAMGFRPRLMHYLLMGAVALTTIAAFESVGAIIVVAMLIAPGATAYLLTDRLGLMLWISVGVGVLCSVMGYVVAIAPPQMDLSISGSMATVAGCLFGLAFLGSPSHGLIPRWARRRRLSLRLAEEHALIDLYRFREQEEPQVSMGVLQKRQGDERRVGRRTVDGLVNQGMVIRDGESLRLTPFGIERAARLIRAHRLWEAYLHRLGLPPDHLHSPADEMEHYISPELQAQLERELEFPDTDPQGKPIPGAESGEVPTQRDSNS